ncbi:alpha/beta fold hydrolase [Nodosilinea sp. P-1105]|uniref:alpha/beta fold hydrolase n=1 Tax=Nodosilinea sp. P-1105 TaxID=2546229 RepID=UPI001F0E083B|nr:alpha/beta fold hydrolase [Nodosilinea sp. P-1105]
MSTFVLVHGAGSGAWVWHKVAPQLEAQGHSVITPDLPGHGLNPLPMAEVSLERYVDCVCDILKGQAEPVVLVGHSLGGAVITQAAEYCPDRIHTLVYLSGYLLAHGESALDIPRPTPNRSCWPMRFFPKTSSRPPSGPRPCKRWATPTAPRRIWP